MQYNVNYLIAGNRYVKGLDKEILFLCHNSEALIEFLECFIMQFVL